MVVIEGEIYFGSYRHIYHYDYIEKSFSNPIQEALKIDSSLYSIRDLAYDNGDLWVLSYNEANSSEAFLSKYDWKSRQQLAVYNIDNLIAPRGLAVHNGSIYIGENYENSPNIHVFKEPIQ